MFLQLLFDITLVKKPQFHVKDLQSTTPLPPIPVLPPPTLPHPQPKVSVKDLQSTTPPPPPSLSSSPTDPPPPPT